MIWPESEEEKTLYIRTEGEIQRGETGPYICLDQGGHCQFDTYFNSLSAGKWKKYTVADKVWINVNIKGKGTIRVWNRERGQAEKVLWEGSWNGRGETAELPCEIKIPEAGIFYLEFESAEPSAEFHGFSFSTEAARLQDVRLSAVICTYKREKDIQRTLTAINEQIFQNSQSPLNKDLRIFVSDNGKTLPESTVPQIRIRKNKNLGGAGGFTRGIMESLRDEKFQATHIVLMDDDAITKPHVLERTWHFLKLLKEEYFQYTIAGALLNQEFPYIQFESGAQWNQGKVKILKNQLDLREIDALLWNECEADPIEYSGWWYSCIPVGVIRKIGLPLPLFVHRDDVEYGLRMERKFITLNGIGIWHEPYINKLPGSAEYYDVRNLAIINAIHYPQLKLAQTNYKIIKWALGNVYRCRYQYVRMNMKGVGDFSKGAEWFLEADGETLHGELRPYNYKMVPEKELYGYHGLQEEDFALTEDKTEIKISMKDMVKYLLTFNGAIFPAKKPEIVILRPYGNEREIYRRKEIVYVDSDKMCLCVQRSFKEMIMCYKAVVKELLSFNKTYKKSAESYRDNFSRLTSWEEWERRLKM